MRWLALPTDCRLRRVSPRARTGTAARRERDGLQAAAAAPGAAPLGRRRHLDRLSSFAEAAKKVLPRMAGLRVNESAAERTTAAAGAELGERLAGGAVFGDCRPWAFAKDARGRTVGYVSLDATGVGIQGPNGSAAEGKMADVGLIFDPGANGRPGLMRASAGLYTFAELGPRCAGRRSRSGWTRPT